MNKADAAELKTVLDSLEIEEKAMRQAARDTAEYDCAGLTAASARYGSIIKRLEEAFGALSPEQQDSRKGAEAEEELGLLEDGADLLLETGAYLEAPEEKTVPAELLTDAADALAELRDMLGDLLKKQ